MESAAALSALLESVTDVVALNEPAACTTVSDLARKAPTSKAASTNMSFGSVLVTLRNSSRSNDGNAHVDGVLGLDVLTRYKAVINCRTKVIFFKVDPTRQMHLSGVAASEEFTRVSMRQEENGAP